MNQQLMPNQQQIESLLRILLAAGGPVAGLLVNWGVPADQVNNYLTIALMVLPLVISGVWSLIRNTHKATIGAAAAVPGVSEVVIQPDATDGAAAAAADPKLTNVNKIGSTP